MSIKCERCLDEVPESLKSTMHIECIIAENHERFVLEQINVASGKCACGNPATEPHYCPFALDIHDSTKKCNCCADCVQNCRDDI